MGGLARPADRTSLRTKLITGLLALVIAAIAAISISSVWVLRSYLTSQDDSQLQVASFYANAVNGQGALVARADLQVRGTTNIFVGVQEPGTPLSPPGRNRASPRRHSPGAVGPGRSHEPALGRHEQRASS